MNLLYNTVVHEFIYCAIGNLSLFYWKTAKLSIV